MPSLSTGDPATHVTLGRPELDRPQDALLGFSGGVFARPAVTSTGMRLDGQPPRASAPPLNCGSNNWTAVPAAIPSTALKPTQLLRTTLSLVVHGWSNATT